MYVHVFVWIFYLLLSCILATKPVRGICGVSWTIGGGGGGATDTGAATPREADKAAERQRAMEVVDREKDNREERRAKRHNGGDKVQKGEKEGKQRKQKACE